MSRKRKESKGEDSESLSDDGIDRHRFTSKNFWKEYEELKSELGRLKIELKNERSKNEAKESREIRDRVLLIFLNGERLTLFCLPKGRFDEKDIQALEDAKNRHGNESAEVTRAILALYAKWKDYRYTWETDHLPDSLPLNTTIRNVDWVKVVSYD